MKAHDLTNLRFGRLTVSDRVGTYRRGPPIWRVVCDCGGTTEVHANNLRSGNTTSCGCVARERLAERVRQNTTHGHATGKISPTYQSWRNARDRVTRKTHPGWSRYGGAGITMCKEWRASFAAFLADMGERPPGKTLDRIDGARGYEPGNCRWATTVEQVKNRKCARWVDDGEERLSLKECAARYRVTPDTLWRHLQAGETLQAAILAIRKHRPAGCRPSA